MSDDLNILAEVAAKEQARKEERLRYLEHRVAELERHRDVLAVFILGAWVALTLAAVLWEYR